MANMLEQRWAQLSPSEKIVVARASLFKKEPFFAVLLTRFKLIKTRGVPLAGVDAKDNLYWNDEGINKLPLPKLEGLIAHEIMHKVLEHMIRTGDRIKWLLNMAQDAIINYMLTHHLNRNNQYQLPDGGILPNYNGEFKIPIDGHEFIFTVTYKDKYESKIKSNERLYEEMYDEIKKVKGKVPTDEEMQAKFQAEVSVNLGGTPAPDQEGKGNDLCNGENPFGFDNHIDKIDGKKISREEANTLRQKNKQQLIQSSYEAKRIGTMSAGLQQIVEEFAETKVPWRTLLARYISEKNLTNKDWLRPNKRGLNMGVWMPKTKREGLNIKVHGDTSGSMYGELELILGALNELVTQFRNIHVEVLLGDTQVLERFELTDTNKEEIAEIANKMTGGGGTSHKPVFEYVEKELDDTKILICVTDGYTSFPEEHEFPFDTLWVITPSGCDEKHIPFGTAIKMRKDEEEQW